MPLQPKSGAATAKGRMSTPNVPASRLDKICSNSFYAHLRVARPFQFSQVSERPRERLGQVIS